jgi:chaperone BCS1
MLNHLLNIAPQRSIILLEDIDAALEKDSKSPNSLTFSGLLNALDGVAATEGGGRLIFMTSNHPEKLPKVLIRPGRVDVKVLVDWATPSQIERMFLKFFPQQYDMAIDFRKKVCGMQVEPMQNDTTAEPHQLSMAQLQGFMLLYKDNPALALENADKLFSLDAIAQDQHKEL